MYLVYGSHQDNNRLIPYTIDECLKKNNFDCSSGKQFRDFLYIDDLLSAIFKCLGNKKAIGQIINIGKGKPENVKKVILLIKNKIKSGKPIFGKISFRKDEIMKLYPNILKSKKILNWSPKTKFEKGIKKVIKYYKQDFYNQ